MAKQVVDRDRSSRIVGAAVTQHSTGIGAAMGDALAPYLKRGEVMPDFALFLTLAGRLVTDRSATLVRSSAAHEAEASDDAEPRARRDASEAVVRQRMSAIRTTVQGTFGDLGLRTLGMWEALPSGPDALANYAQNVEKLLRQPGLALQSVLPEDASTFLPKKHADALRPLLAALETALGDVARERSELDTTLLAKNQAMAAHDRDFVRFGGLIEQAARAAGLVELADRIRPSGRDPGVLADTGDPAVDPAAVVAGAVPASPATPAVEPGMPGSNPFRS
jgi:hypothetical protein